MVLINSINTMHQTHYNFWMCHAIVPQVKKASSEKISNISTHPYYNFLKIVIKIVKKYILTGQIT